MSDRAGSDMQFLRLAFYRFFADPDATQPKRHDTTWQVVELDPASKKPRHAYHSHHGVQARVGMVKTSAGHVHVADFHRYGQVVANEPMHAGSGLEIELKRTTQIWGALPGGRDPRASIDKRNPARAGGEIIAQVWCQPNTPSQAGRELSTGKNLPAQFQISTIPVANAYYRAEHVAVGKADQSQIVSNPAAKPGKTSAGTGFQSQCLSSRAKALTDAILPDGGW